MTWSSCAPTCTGVTLSRYLDFGGDYIHQAEGCTLPAPLSYPATESNAEAEALVLDSSAGDLSALSF